MFRLPALIAAAVVLAGCDGSDRAEVAAPDPVAGIYLLETIGGKAMPAILIDENGYTLSVIGGAYSLTSAGTFTSSFTIRESIETVTVPSVDIYDEKGSGVYSVAAQFVRFTDAFGSEVTAQLSGATLTFGTNPARVYRR